MKNYNYLAKELVNEVKKTNEYNHYHRVLKKIVQEKELYDTMNQYRKKSLDFQMISQEDAYDIMLALQQEYRLLLSNPLVQEFLTAEQRLTSIGKEVTDYIIASLDLDISFLEEV